MSEIAIGIDLGGTRIKAVAIDRLGKILVHYYHPTNDNDGATWRNAINLAVQQIKSKLQVTNLVVGISAPGIPNGGNSAISFMPGRLSGLENFNWSEFLQVQTFVLNDAISAMLAETRFGVAKNICNVIMLTLGTGVGGAIQIEGKPYQGAFNKAGHIGHMVIDSGGDVDVTGMPGSLEDAIGNCTIERRTFGKFSSTRKLLDAYNRGDRFAGEVWNTSVRKLAIGLASLTNILSPEMIILGGGITEAGSDLFDPLEEYMTQYEWRTGGSKALIVKAQYGDLAGAVGAACFAMESKIS